jgi:glycosyltransferase involved in cell wall biosynthesis
VKAYKNYEALADALNHLGAGSFARLTIAGQPSGDVILPDESYRRNLELDLRLRFIPDEEVAQLFAAAHFLVLPYTESLTSGAAALSMGFGVPVIAPALGGMREAVPPQNWPLIYDIEEPDGLACALRLARDMSAIEYRALVDRCMAFGEEIHPDRISSELIHVLAEHGIVLSE